MRLRNLITIRIVPVMIAIFIGVIALAVVNRRPTGLLVHQQETTKQTELEKLSHHRNNWLVGHWPPPDTPVRINSPFGRYSIPLQNLGGRNEFLQKTLEPSRVPAPSPDGSFNWNSFSLSFWMPDGVGVLTNAPGLLTYAYFDAADLKWHHAPMRPRELGRLDPSPTRYTVVVAEFCPRVGPPPPPPFQGFSLMYEGYGYGAFNMWGCAVHEPGTDWTSMNVHGPGDTEIFCHTDDDICFGWIDLIDESVRALTYMPRDAVLQSPEIAFRMHALLRNWKIP